MVIHLCLSVPLDYTLQYEKTSRVQPALIPFPYFTAHTSPGDHQTLCLPKGDAQIPDYHPLRVSEL